MIHHRKAWGLGTIHSRVDPDLVRRVTEARERLQIGPRYAVVTKIEKAAA